MPSTRTGYECQELSAIVPTALYGAEARVMRSAERRKADDLDEVFEKFGWSVTNG